jgi:lipopolysaccharide assembly protein A
MQFLRTLFWVVLAVLGVIFAFNNSQVVTISLWRDIVVDTPLWMVALIAFLAGLLPMLVLYRATKWTLKRRLESANRALVEPASSLPATPVSAMPPGAAPIVPPAGVA